MPSACPILAFYSGFASPILAHLIPDLPMASPIQAYLILDLHVLFWRILFWICQWQIPTEKFI
jgi:hypothetical protein